MTEKQIQSAIASQRNLFITGAAGTGKSTRLQELIDKTENVLVCAPTGIAALHIGGETAHKVFHIPVPAYEAPSFAKKKKGALTESMLKTLKEADMVIIDEISMFKNSDFEFAMKVLHKAERLAGKKIRVIVSGDFSQLPPVVKKTEEKLMKKFGFDLSGFAFTSKEWKKLNFKVVELTEVKRQSDKEFITELNKVRCGDTSSYDYFNQFVSENPDYTDAICICGTNAEAEKINNEYLNELPGADRALRAEKFGRVSAMNVNEIIVVKEGAQVVFTANDMRGNRFQNGSFGIVKGFYEDKVIVTVGGKDVFVEKQKVSAYSYQVTGNQLQKKEIGYINQYPFQLGKAITIHKSQGQTFEKVVIQPTIFAAGQLYVALSRVKSPEGLTLTKPVTPEDFRIHEVVEQFYQDGYTYEVSEKKKVIKSPTTKNTTKKSAGTTKKTTKKMASKTTKSVAKKATTKKTTSMKTQTGAKSARAKAAKKPVRK